MQAMCLFPFLSCVMLGKRAKLILEQDTPNLRWCGAPLFGQAFDFLERVVFNPNCKPTFFPAVVALIHWACLRIRRQCLLGPRSQQRTYSCASLRQLAGARH